MVLNVANQNNTAWIGAYEMHYKLIYSLFMTYNLIQTTRGRV